jgi:hypothetical protein
MARRSLLQQLLLEVEEGPKKRSWMGEEVAEI